MRLIDADALIDDINNGLWDWEQLENITGITVLKQTISDIQNAPVIDAVPVIRCKDCRFCRKYKYREDVCTCLKFDSGRNMYDYCSYAQIKEADFGERRNDDCN